MIELRADGSIPGPNIYGRVYKIVNLMTGEIGYNFTGSDLPGLDPASVKMIEGYDTFKGWATEILSYDEAWSECQRLNKQKQFEETPHTKLVARVKQRLEDRNAGTIDFFDVLDDMQEMYKDIMGRRERPPLAGWK